MSSLTCRGWTVNSPTPAPVPVGRRLFRRALDLFVIAFLGMVGLSTGSQLVDWWRADPAPPDLSGISGLDPDWTRVPVSIQFGAASTRWERVPFEGDRLRLQAELERIGKQLVSSSAVPTGEVDGPERAWIEFLNQEPALFWDSTEGNVYRRDEPLPSFVATRFAEAGGLNQRIVGWGIAFPAGPSTWTIYVLRPDDAATQSAPGPAPLELPDSSRSLAMLADTQGTRWQVIQGRGPLAHWVKHFEQALSDGQMLSRQVGVSSASLKSRRDGSLTEIHIQSDRHNVLTALIWVAKEGPPR